jgi:hypothetical protein
MDVTIGRIVHYTLTDQDAVEINRRRTTGMKIAERIKLNTETSSAWPLGAQAHIGNEAKAGAVVPMIVVAVWSPTTINGQAFLDGNDTLWVTSATYGEMQHQWKWPAIAPMPNPPANPPTDGK